MIMEIDDINRQTSSRLRGTLQSPEGIATHIHHILREFPPLFPTLLSLGTMCGPGGETGVITSLRERPLRCVFMARFTVHQHL